ncbi:MAG: hypothetical protein KF729_25155 [Sandaracinaceae bacterium]|nr:hypothetical protein [Sandaracinaceae bacterium]
MNDKRTLWVALAAIGMAAGCTESHGGGEDAGTSITFDASFPDGGPDAGIPEANVGAPCRGDTDCDGTGVFCDDEFPGGYCSAACAADEPCPDGASCIETRTGGICLDDCDFMAADGDFCARDGYGCADMVGVCLPGCDVDRECPTGRVCDPNGGFNGEGSCQDPSASLGDACTMASDCPPGTTCLSERFTGIPGGVCGQFGCNAADGTGCPENGTCVPAGRGGVCLLACASDADCTRADQTCTPGPNGSYCGPRFNPANLGQACSAGRGGCAGGACLTESETGWPDSYCVALGCDPVAQTGCPGDGVCIATADGRGACLDGCARQTDCRDGYWCRPADAADPTSPTACVPGCETAAVCGNEGYVCNTGTGLCREPFVETALGEPCGAMGCTGGQCLTEAASGWPAGTCTYPGCRLTGTGPMAECPAGGVCIDDEAGDPALGVCVRGCTAPADCRPGYACREGACRPACGASDCSGTRTCNTESGLCR